MTNIVAPCSSFMESYGHYLIGELLYMALWGIACSQVFLYFMHYPNDRIWIKLLVMTIWCLDTANILTVTISLFRDLAESESRSPCVITSVLHPPITRDWPWMTALIFFSVQAFYLRRIYKFSSFPTASKACLVASLGIASLWQIVGSILWIVAAVDPLTADEHTLKLLEVTVRASSALVDIFIAGIMTYLLAKQRQDDLIRSNKLLFRLILMSISTGAWTAAAAIVDLALVITGPNMMTFVVVEFPLSGLYVNALLANLNARDYLQRSTLSIQAHELRFHGSMCDSASDVLDLGSESREEVGSES
ncbi:hypothetical protein PHLGIDRAFT_413089 [Phlebiopsis gigantea 11061_1 CR5-6]|uniref:DUF6534 domain-containing protein n=1 Tax=Phlebiopsis gigantea (strain 11061_1 CR5-6) TaxID=745531 RepID=A0A0C3RZ65_PHLG1|nr:hypothetical protein PHLGIDRAFT_413089 [Phlebiopsis gigantea 11061_1 CR5-6]